VRSPAILWLVAALLGSGCAPALSRLPAPTASTDATGPARLDPELMSRFLAAQRLLSAPQIEGPDPRPAEAAALIQEALAIDPKAPALWQALADARARSGDYGAAAGAARQAVLLDPGNARSRYMLGELLHRLGELEEAEVHLRAATEIGLGGDDPHLPHYYLYFVLRELGRPDAALAALDGWIEALPEDTYPTVLKARLLMEHSRPVEARAAALVALQRAPGSEDALGVYLDTFRIGLTSESPWSWQDAVRLPDAVAGLEEVLRGDWSRARLHRVLLSLYRRMGRYDRAEEHLRFVRILGREREAALDRQHIELLILQHRNVEAAREIDRELASLETSPDDRVALLRLQARSEEDVGDFEAALRTLAEVSTDHAQYGEVALAQVRLLRARGEAAQAASAAITARAVVAIRDVESHAGLQDAALRARIDLGDLVGARTLLPDLERMDPRRAEAARTALLLAEGKGDRAAAMLRDRASRAPGDEELAIALSDVLARIGQRDAAMAALTDAEEEVDRQEASQLHGVPTSSRQAVEVRAERQRVALWTQRARLLEAAGDVPGAVAVLERVLEVRPQNADILNFVGYLLADAELRLDDAERYLLAAADQRAFSGAVIDSMGWLRFRQGRLDEALELLEKANRFAPEDPELLEHLGQVYAAQGRIAEASATWRRALAAADSREELAARIRDGLRGLEAQGKR
jgi:tetratricopeptide (TPR) repeat protein